MGRLDARAPSPVEHDVTGGPDDRREGAALGQLRGCRWAVGLGLDQVEAELVAVHGRPPLVQARLSVAAEDLTVMADAGSASAALQFELHLSELPAELRAAVQSLQEVRSPAASLQ